MGAFEEKLTADLTFVLETAMAKGFMPPFHFAILGANGAYLVGILRLDADREDATLIPEFTAEGGDPRGLQLPVNMMLVDDATGEAMNVRWDTSTPHAVIH